MHNPFSIFDEESWQFKTVERFIIVLYDLVNTHEKVNEALWGMFCQDGKMESLRAFHLRKMHCIFMF